MSRNLDPADVRRLGKEDMTRRGRVQRAALVRLGPACGPSTSIQDASGACVKPAPFAVGPQPVEGSVAGFRSGSFPAAVMTKGVDLAWAPGNVLCRRRETGLRLDSVVNVSAVLTIYRSLLLGRVGPLATRALQRVDVGLRLALGL